jgi:hypothetical protein
MGCDQYQGFHFSAPLPAAAFSEFMRGKQQEEDVLTESDAIRTHSKLSAYRR